MIHWLEFFTGALFAITGLTVWACLLLASWADTRLDEFGLGEHQEFFHL